MTYEVGFGYLERCFPEATKVGGTRWDQVPLDVAFGGKLGDLAALGTRLEHGG